jgi:hypothetical protein
MNSTVVAGHIGGFSGKEERVSDGKAKIALRGITS